MLKLKDIAFTKFIEDTPAIILTMIIILIVSVGGGIIVTCTKGESVTDTTTLKKHAIFRGNNEVYEIVIDNCQYLANPQGTLLTHKGNCTNHANIPTVFFNREILRLNLGK